MTGKSKLNFFDRIILWINYPLCAALVICYLSPYVDPRKIWLIAFFGLAYPPLIFFNAVFIVYWLLRRKLYVLLSLITVLVGWGALRSNIGFNLSRDLAQKPAGNYLRVMTYNVHCFQKYGEWNDKSTKHEILELIDHQQPDIIGFQEYYTRRKGKYAMTDSLRQLFKSDYFFCKLFAENIVQGMGMAIFSKYPIVNQGVILLSEKSNLNQCIYVDVNRNGQLFRFYSIHLRSINFDPQDYRFIDSVTKEGKADLSGSRKIGGKLKRAFIIRSEQVQLVKDHANQCPYPYIISGDFNDTPLSYAVNKIAKGLKDAFREKGFGLGRTYNGNFPNYQIDYIFASPQFGVASYKIIEQKLSDHFPVRADLLLPSSSTPSPLNNASHSAEADSAK